MGIIKEFQSDLDNAAVRVVGEYRARLHAEAAKLCGDASEADDLVMRTFDAAFCDTSSYDATKGELYPWLVGVLRRIYAKTDRRLVNRGTTPVDPAVLQDMAGISEDTVDEILERSDHDALREAMNRLDPEYKKMLVMHYFGELPVKQIATVMNVPVGTVLWRLNIARKILARDLGEKLGKKPVSVLLAALLGLGTLFGAWVSPLGDWVAEKVFGNTSVEVSHLDEAPFIIDPISGTGEDPVEPDNPVTLPQTNDNVISETPKQESETNMNISAQIKKTVAATAVVAMGFAARADLPPSYVQCEYIESTGWEYIKTGILPSRSTRFVVDFQMLQATAPRDIRGRLDNPAMGGNSPKCQFDIGAQPNGENGCIARARCHDNWGGYVVYEDVNAFERTVVELRGDGSVWANGVQRTTQTALGTNPDTSFEASGGLYLFAVNEPRESWDASFPCVMRMFGCQFYDGETLVRDFVPCFHLTSNAYGLYDTVEKRFYGNASGQGAFSGDAEIAATPLEKGEWTRFRYQSVLTFEKTTAEKPLSDIPVLVRISESRIDGFSYGDCDVNVKMGVVDLAFALSPRGTWLDYEIEKWDPSGESLVWVRIPKLTNKTQIKMYWGVKDAQDHIVPPSGASVWSTNGYSTVLHMNALNGMDATGENEYTALAAAQKSSAGPVGECLRTAAVEVSRDGGQAPWAKALTSKSFTMSFWVYFTTGGSPYPYMAQWGTSNLQDADGFWLGASQDPKVGSYGTAFWFTAHSQICAVFKTLKPELDWEKLNYNNQWVHYAYSYEQLEDGSAHVRAFLNGTQVNEVTQELPNGATSFITAASNDLRLLGGYSSSSDKMQMDEFRLSPVARDADYVSTAYRTMAESDFITMSAAGKATSPTRGLVIMFF